MMTDSEIVNYIKTSDNVSKSFIFKHCQKIITEEHMNTMRSFINSHKTITSLATVLPYSKSGLMILLNAVLPLAFSKKQIIDYFLYILNDMFNDENKWHKPSCFKIYKEVVGTAYQGNKKGYFLMSCFQKAYANFTENGYYPDEVKKRTVKRILNNEPLADDYKEFMSKYGFESKHNDCYFAYFRTYIFEKYISDEQFENYIVNCCIKYMNSVPVNHSEYFTVTRITSYLFGYPFAPSCRAVTNNNGKNKKIYMIMQKAIFETIPRSRSTAYTRNKIYTEFDYTKEEIEKAEAKVAETSYLPAAIHGMVSKEIDELEILEHGNSLKETADAVQEYILVTYKKKDMREIPKKNVLKKEAITYYNLRDSSIAKDIKYTGYITSYKYSSYIMNAIESSRREVLEFYLNNNEYERMSRKDYYVFYYNDDNRIYKKRVDLSDIKSDFFKEEVRFCIQDNKTDKYKYYEQINVFISAIIYYEKRFGITHSSELTMAEILSYFHYLDHEKHVLPTTISEHISILRKMMNVVTEHKEYVFCPSVNLYLGITFSNLQNQSQNTPVIPDDILLFLDNHISELNDERYSLTYRLLSETGWRYREVALLQVDELYLAENDNGEKEAFAKSLISKTWQAKLKRNMDDKLMSSISLDLYTDVISYIEKTKDLRKQYNTDKIFFTIADGVAVMIRPTSFNRMLNNLLKRNNMSSIDESYDGIYSKQTRKTVASTLINNGASLAEVQQQLGHMHSSTTKKYYAEVSKKRLADLDQKFFKEKFGAYIDNDNLKYFSEEERKILYTDFALNHRTVELGLCSKHPSEGRCPTIGHTSCALCPKLCTGKKWLPKWEKLAADELYIIKQLEQTYEKHGIEESEYKDFLEYKQEKKLYNGYIEVISAIKAGKR